MIPWSSFLSCPFKRFKRLFCWLYVFPAHFPHQHTNIFVEYYISQLNSGKLLCCSQRIQYILHYPKTSYFIFFNIKECLNKIIANSHLIYKFLCSVITTLDVNNKVKILIKTNLWYYVFLWELRVYSLKTNPWIVNWTG